MGQPKADEKHVNAPTLTDEDFLSDFLLDDEDEDKSKADPQPPANTAEMAQLKAEFEAQKKQTEALLKQQERLLATIAANNQPPVQPMMEIPPQPDEYDETEAYVNPKSASWKWRINAERVAKKQEQQEMLAAIGSFIDEKIKAQHQVSEIARQEQELVNSEKIDSNELENFRTFLTTQKALDMKDLYQIFKAKSGKKDQIVVDQGKRQFPSMPTMSDFGGPQKPTEDEEEGLTFEKALLKSVKGTNNKY